MDVILLTKVANLGNIGDRVNVKSGYGRNFLLPSGKATLATPANVAKFEARRAELEKIAREQFADAESRAQALKDFTLRITAKAGNEGKLFGSIGTTDIAEVGDLVEKDDVHDGCSGQCWSVYGSNARKRARRTATASCRW